MKILAFETSCDETSVAITEEHRVLVNLTRSQLVHSQFGGIVPELAAREHIRYIKPMTDQALRETGIAMDEIQAVAVTYGPGLASSLMVGLVFAKTIAQITGKKLIGVNHLEGHIFSVLIDYPHLKPPFISLIVSGGHTELILVEDWFRYRLLGETVDDAAGEAFDKVARLLGLPYPGGPQIDRLAKEGNPQFVKFTIPRIKSGPLNFSFSGIKTAVRILIEKNTPEWVEKHRADIAASFQETVVQMLFRNVEKAVRMTGVEKVAVVGGVSLNSRLREVFRENLKEVYFPSKEYCMDNAAMIGVAGYYRLKAGFESDLSLPAVPDLQLEYVDDHESNH